MYICVIMETLIMHPENKEQAAALKAVAKALKVDFETDKGSPYNPEFVAKVLAGVNDRKAGKRGRRVDVENLWK
jgi:hypothetical protein